MKKAFTQIVMAMLLMVSTLAFATDSLFISEVADPGDNYKARFVELYNAGSEAIDFGTTEVYFARQANGGSWASTRIVGSIAAGAAFVIATDSAEFNTAFGFDPDDAFSSLTGNGDDGYFLYLDGDHSTGTVIDVYGVADVDGTGEDWEYLDSRAIRVGGIKIPNLTWTASEWEISPANVADCTPGVHDTTKVIDVTPPVWETGYPSAANILDVQFDLLAQLDESSMVYYVVLDNDAPAPTVEEVKAGTGSGGATAVVASAFAAGKQEATETVSGLVVETDYDIYLVAEDDEAVPNVQAAVVLVEVSTVIVPDVILKVGFDNELAPFTEVSIVGSQDWYQSSYNNDGFAKISGYSSGNQDNDDYLISPAIDLDGSTDNMFSFHNAVNFTGPALQVLISTDFPGTFDSTSVVDATWTDLTDQFSYSGGNYAWEESGAFDLAAYSGTVYIAFRYLSNPADGASTWEVDNFMVTGFMAAGTDATLSDLQVDGTSVEGFEAAKYNYVIELPAGTTTVPTVTATTTDAAATPSVTDATDLSGDAAARTTTIAVVAADGVTTQDYTIVFNPILEVANLGELRSLAEELRTYVVTGEVLITYQQSYRNKKYVQDGTGGVEIDDGPGMITTSYAVGDGMTGLTGTVEDYNGLLQFHPSSDPGAASSTGNVIEPTVVTPAEVNASIDTYESTLVQLKSVTITEADGSAQFENGANYELNGEAESMVLRVHFYGTTLTGTLIPDSSNVAGIILEYNGTAQVSPRSADDVEELIVHVPSSDATLSDLQVDGTTVTGFSPALLSYVVTLPGGTTDIPVVTAATADVNATQDITPATDLSGDEAARTTTVVVTAEDGVTLKTYTVIFQLAVSVENELFESVRIYPVPAMDKLFIDHAQDIQMVTLLSLTGSLVMQIENNGEPKLELDLTSLNSGIYLIKLENEKGSGVYRITRQ